MNLREEIAVFEKRLGCRVAFHDLTGEITALAEPEELPLHHLAPCCEEMRSRNRECYERCVQCDTRLIQPHLAAGRPFRKLCHAGFFEAVFPLMKFGAPAGVMFLGVFRPPEGALPEVFQPPEKVVFPPELEPPEDLIWFGSLFADSIRRRLEEIPGDGPRGGRGEQTDSAVEIDHPARRKALQHRFELGDQYCAPRRIYLKKTPARDRQLPEGNRFAQPGEVGGRTVAPEAHAVAVGPAKGDIHPLVQ